MRIKQGIAILTLLVTMAGCSSSPDQAAVDVDPTWQEAVAGPASVHLPPEFEEHSRSDDGGSLVVTYAGPPDENQLTPTVAFEVVDDPERNHDETAQALVMGEKAMRGAEDVVTEEIELPGTDGATEVSFWQDIEGASGSVPVKQRVVVADLSSGPQVVLAVIGPREGFDTSDLATILGTLTVS